MKKSHSLVAGPGCNSPRTSLRLNPYPTVNKSQRCLHFRLREITRSICVSAGYLFYMLSVRNTSKAVPHTGYLRMIHELPPEPAPRGPALRSLVSHADKLRLSRDGSFELTHNVNLNRIALSCRSHRAREFRSINTGLSSIPPGVSSLVRRHFINFEYWKITIHFLLNFTF